MGLTQAQEQAVVERGNVLVVAGAGTGKTRTLVERCLRCLLEETPSASLEQILVVTFTEAAATEIRQRIRLRLEQEQNKAPNDFRWQEQLALFDTAHIGTLHGFCLQLIRPHFYELEIDPQLSVLAEDEAQLLAEETLTKVLEGHYEETAVNAQAVQQLIQSQGKGSDQAIRALVLRLHHYTQTLPDPEAWFEKHLASFASLKPVHWLEWLLAAFAEFRKDWLPLLQADTTNNVAKTCAALLAPLPPAPSRDAIALALQTLISFCSSCSQNKKPGWLKNLGAEAQFLLSLADPGEKMDPLVEDWEWVRQPMATLLDLTREFSNTFSENKRQLGVLDFHDLEQHALRLLWDQKTAQPSRVATQWRQKLRFIFVDEYQDINAAQDKIIEAISGQGPASNRFLVGDMKQSIYRFRQADPRIFQDYAKSWRGDLGQTITLGDNFRSREGILDFINSLFTLVMREELGGVAYDQQAQLRFGDPEQRAPLKSENMPFPQAELHLRVKAANGDAEFEGPMEDALDDLIDLEEAAKEARLVALRCRELKARHHPVWDEAAKTFRPVAWGDIAVLLRSPAGKSECYAKEFSRLEVPLLVQRSGFYDSIEVLDLVNLLQVLDNPLQDAPVLAVLHSPLAGLTVNELATIRLAAKGPYWTALVLWHDSKTSTNRERPAEKENETAKASSSDQATLRKVIAFLDRYSRWRRLARQSSLSRCLEVALAETQYDTFLLTQPRGEQRHANVQRLLRLAQQFDNFQRQGLFRFLRFIDAQRRAETEPDVKPVAMEDSVRLMSIHQSKGLEFPVVVIADLNKPFNLTDLRAGVILDEEYGVCPQIKPPHTGKRYPSLPYWLARRRQMRELLGEELRLLYVAMTRARDTLILFASITEKRLEGLGNGNHKFQSPKDARSFFDWIAFWFSKHYAETGSRSNLIASAMALERRPSGATTTVPGGKSIPPETMFSSGQTRLLSWAVHHENKLLEPGAELANESIEPQPTDGPEVWARLQERLSWQYSFLASTRTPAKASVTTLRKQATHLRDEEIFDLRPASYKNQNRHGKEPSPDGAIQGQMHSRASAAEIGSAHHRFLQLMSIENAGNVADLAKEARRLQKENLLGSAELELLDYDAVAAFWNSELGLRIRDHAAEMYRELQFTARFSTRTLMELTEESAFASLQNEFVVVQGVADLVILSPQTIWLVDFKTDAIKPDMLASRVRLYQPQMKLYACALSQIYRRPVTGCWLYFLACGQAMEILCQDGIDSTLMTVSQTNQGRT